MIIVADMYNYTVRNGRQNPQCWCVKMHFQVQLKLSRVMRTEWLSSKITVIIIKISSLCFPRLCFLAEPWRRDMSWWVCCQDKTCVTGLSWRRYLLYLSASGCGSLVLVSAELLNAFLHRTVDSDPHLYSLVALRRCLKALWRRGIITAANNTLSVHMACIKTWKNPKQSLKFWFVCIFPASSAASSWAGIRWYSTVGLTHEDFYIRILPSGVWSLSSSQYSPPRSQASPPLSVLLYMSCSLLSKLPALSF